MIRKFRFFDDKTFRYLTIKSILRELCFNIDHCHLSNFF